MSMKHIKKYKGLKEEITWIGDKEFDKTKSKYNASMFYEAYSQGGGDMLGYGEIIEMMELYNEYKMNGPVPEHVTLWFTPSAPSAHK